MFKNKIFPLLLSLVIAFGLWSYVITFVSAEREDTFYDIPVSIQGEAILEERGLMITSGEKPEVTLTLYGNRRDLNKLDSSNIIVIADVSKIGEAGTHSLLYSVYYPGDVPDNAFTVQSQYPSMVKITVERRITKNVPVEIVYNGTVAADYIADKDLAELDNEHVTITGPASVVDQMAKAVIQVDLEGRTDSFIEPYPFTLCNAAGEAVDAKMVEVNCTEVNLTLYIRRVKEIPLVVTVIDGGGATETTSSITVEPKVIKVAGNDNVLADLEELNLGTIDLAELTADETLTFDITMPTGVENLTGQTEAKVTVEFPDLLTRRFSITKFDSLNVPEGMEVEYITQELVITLRGPKTLVSQLTNAGFSVTVDFSDAQLGTDTYKANVVMNGGFTKVGALGQYKISATLVDPNAEEDTKP